WIRVDAPPIAADDSFITTPHDAPLDIHVGVLANDSDYEGDPLFAQLGVGPGHGTLTFRTDGTFVYTPNSIFYGNDSFTYSAWDGYASSTATATIHVLPIDQGLDVNNDEFTGWA